jgi:hypothetical protein
VTANLVVTRGPIVTSATSVLGHEYVFSVVQLGIRRVDNALDDSRLQIEKYGSWDVMIIVGLKNRIFILKSSLDRTYVLYYSSTCNLTSADVI